MLQIYIYADGLGTSSPQFPEAPPDYIQNVENVVMEGSIQLVMKMAYNIGNDVIYGSGHDIISGGAGNDTQAGNDDYLLTVGSTF